MTHDFPSQPWVPIPPSFPQRPKRWGCPQGGEEGVQTLWFGLSSVQSRQSRQLLGRRGESKRGGEEPCTVPVGAQAGRLAGRRKPKLFGATLGEIALWNVPSLHSSQCLKKRSGEITGGLPCSLRCLLLLCKRGWPFGDTLKLLHQTVLVREATQPVCSANTARVLGSSVPHTSPSGLWFGFSNPSCLSCP